MEWVLVVWLTLYGEGSYKLRDEAVMPDREACFAALDRVRFDTKVPGSSDKRRAIVGAVAYCKPRESG